MMASRSIRVKVMFSFASESPPRAWFEEGWEAEEEGYTTCFGYGCDETC